MYRDLGFIRLVGRPSVRTGHEPRRSSTGEAPAERGAEGETDSYRSQEETAPQREDGARGGQRAAPEPSTTGRGGAPAYAYLLYPHKPVLAYEPQTHRLLSEYCVEFPDLSDAVTGARLPGSDDVLAKWMALTGDEARLLRDANMHLPGRQLDPGRVRRDLWRLGEWERRRRSADTSSR